MSQSSSFTFSVPNDSMYYFNLDLKMSAILLFIILFCIFMSSISPLIMPYPKNRCYMEPYTNEEMYSHTDVYKNIKYTNYSRTALTAPDNLDTKTPQNLTFGTAVRILSSKVNDKNMYYDINIDANLYVLGGNIYNEKIQTSIDQEYIVQLINPSSNKIINLGPMKKDNDGIYKLKYSLNIDKIPSSVGYTIDDLLKYNIVKILYVTKNPKTNNIITSNVIIEGDLNKMQ